MVFVLVASFFLLGLIFGSFFNVVGLRVPLKKSFVQGRSGCPQCGHELKWYELIPLVSYVIQGGRCRQCSNKIGFIYPAIELSTGVLFAVSAVLIGLDAELIMALLLVSMLMIIFVSDVTYLVIPDKILLFFLPFIVLMRFIQPLDPWWSPIAGGLAGFALLALIIFISRGGMGAGDMKLFGVLGIVLGLKKILLAFLLSTVIGALVGVALLLTETIGRKQQIPFGPYIVAGALVTYFFGDFLADWYIHLLV